MEKITNEDIKVTGRIVSISTEGIVADAEQIWDGKFGEDGAKQSDINQMIKNLAGGTTAEFVRITEDEIDLIVGQ